MFSRIEPYELYNGKISLKKSAHVFRQWQVNNRLFWITISVWWHLLEIIWGYECFYVKTWNFGEKHLCNSVWNFRWFWIYPLKRFCFDEICVSITFLFNLTARELFSFLYQIPYGKSIESDRNIEKHTNSQRKMALISKFVSDF